MSGERGSERIHSVDALRTFLMFAGIFVHAGTYAVPVLHGIIYMSGLFRMEGFFLLSGFFAAMSLARTDPQDFLMKRMPGMLVPLAVVLPLNFVVLWLVGVYAESRTAAFPGVELGPLPHEWYLHLWFLMVLAGFAASAPYLDPLAARAGKLLAGVRVVPIALAIALLVAMEVFVRGSLDATALVWPSVETEWLIVAQFIYLPFYMLGMLAWHHQSLRDALIAPSGRAAATWTLVAAVAFALVVSGFLPGPVRVLTENVFGVAVIGVLAYAFKVTVRRRTPFLALMSESVYTAYLLHFAFIWAVLAALAGVFESYWPIYAAAVFAGFAGPLLIHAYGVRRSDVVGFLLNGRMQRRAPAPATLAAETPAS